MSEKLQVEYLPIDALIPYARNMNAHSDEHVAELAASIKEFGWTIPVLIDKASVLVAGHGRVLAARKLGMTEVPCIRRDAWSETQVKAYRIADNRLPKNAVVDVDMLELEIRDLSDEGFNLDVLGFDPAEIESMLRVAEEVDLPPLADGDREPFQEMVFSLHDEQVEQVKRALEVAVGMGPFGDTANENRNGNALARICEVFITQHG